MTELPRKSLSEILARYENEPDLRDLYTEGTFDRELLEHVIRKSAHRGVVVYEIDSVDLPDSLLASMGLTAGQKQRVIALARHLEHLGDECRFRCIADQDLDSWFGPLEGTRRLKWTEYSSVESYFLSEAMLHDILVTTAKARIADFALHWSSLTTVLRDLFSLRLADRELSWRISWISFERCLSRSGDAIQLDTPEYINRLLSKSGRLRERHLFTKSADAWKARLIGDPRRECRGHDLVALLAWVVGAFKGVPALASDDAIERLLVLLSPQQPGMLSLAVD